MSGLIEDISILICETILSLCCDILFQSKSMKKIYKDEVGKGRKKHFNTLFRNSGILFYTILKFKEW